MKNKKLDVLFVSSGNTKNGISPIVKAQAESLIENGVNIDFFTISGKGIKGYLKNVFPLRRIFEKGDFDIVHSHYSLSSFVASLANVGLTIQQVTSLMGSDVNVKGIWKFFIKIFNKLFWQAVIVKSEDMKDKISIKENIHVIPNGVNFKQFPYLEKSEAQEIVGFDKTKLNIIWVSNPERPEKNFKLAKKAVELLDYGNVKLNVVNGVNHNEIYKYMYAADLLLLTSLWEGSPNVVKEAMACNLPVVSTDVGDVKNLFGNEPGHYLSFFDADDMAQKIQLALQFSEQNGKTNGRQRIIDLGLDSKTITGKIIDIYKDETKRYK